jgi:signal transduction histidine kinase
MMSDALNQTVSLVRLAAERMASGPHDEQRFLELTFALDRAVERHLRYQDLLELFEAGAAAAPASDAWAWRLAAGLAANLRGDTAAAIRSLEQGGALLEASGLGNSAAAAFLQSELARAHYHAGDHAMGIEVATRGLQLARAANSQLAEAYAHHYVGLISIRQRDFAYARRHLNAARDAFERMHQRGGRARVLDSLAYLELEQGGHSAARELLQQSLSVKHELRDLRGQALASLNLARLLTTIGEFQNAQEYLDRARDLAARIGDDRNANQIQLHVGELHLRCERHWEARENLIAARELAHRRADPRLEAYACFALAEAERRCGDLAAAREAIQAARAYFDASDDLILKERAELRKGLYSGADPEAPAIAGPLERLRRLEIHAPLAEALYEAGSYLRESGHETAVAVLYAEALDAAEPAQGALLATQMRARAQTPEGRAWVDAMWMVKQQKDQLEDAVGELRQAEALRGSLTQMIVHDLKNPLAAITPYLQMVQGGGLSADETTECLQIAIDECDYMLRLIEDLNDVGRMQHHTSLELTREPLSLRAMLSEVQRRLQNRARDSGMTIFVDDPLEEDPLPSISGDENKLRRALENLVANAIKYGRPDEGSTLTAEVRLSASLEPGSPDGGPGAIRVEVRDHGPGIPAAEAERVFDAYYQAEAGRKRKAGVGLGLAFCRMVVEAHGGTIWTAPNPHGGTIFAFRIPLS